MKRAMRRRKTWQRQTAAITAAMMAMSVGGIAYAMPQGEVIRSGKGEVTRQDKDMTVNQDSKRLAIDWAGFDIANDERVTFRQPDRDSVALNRVVGDAASVIDGALSGNGHVYVINPNGVLFGKNASVDVGSLVASTARISDRDMTNFAGADGITMAIPEDSSAKVINAGTIRAEGGLVVLHAAEVENSGTITNPAGTTALAAARNLSLSADTAGKINFTVDGALAKAKALNSGMLKADGGYLVMTARSAGDVMSTVVNNTGTMEAKTLRQNEKGEIFLDGGDNGVVELSGTIDASGMEAGQSAGSIKAIGAETHVKDGATLHATGAVDGGLIETSGDYLEIGDTVDIDAAGKTGKAGEWLLDPTEVIIKDSGTGTVNGGSNAYTSGTTYLKTSTIANILKKNDVKIQATDRTYHNADITLASALNVDATTAGENTLTLEAEESVNINADINATAPLNIVLNADTNGDDKGGVNINADIRTGGGSLTTGANGATFFGVTSSGDNNRAIETSGGNVNIQNEARLQLNGGTLSVNTAGGSVTFARNVASMNKYEAFMDHDFVAYYSQDYPRGKLSAEGQAWEDMIKSVYEKSYTDADGQQVKFVIQGRDYWGVYDKAYEDLSNSEKLMLSNKLAQIWELANLAATQNNSASDPNGKNLDGQHLVTITDKYENSAAMAPARKISGSVIEYFTGGKETTTNPSASKVSGREFSWVTGPEKGQVFYITDGIGSGADQNGMYTNWVRNVPTGNSDLPYYNEPNNNGGRTSQPYVAIGWTDQNGWDDVGNNATTIHGFIRETELPNSVLSINSGAGNVTVGTEGVADTGRLGSGEGTGLRNLSIESTTGDVKVLGSIYVHDNHANAAADLANGNVKIATQGNVDVGQITADKKVEIATTGADKDVTVNGKIATDGLVSIEATDDITVHGIENGDKIRLISTNPNGDGAITLANNVEDGGALITTSDANDAVIIDARGADGSFKNLTTAEKAIDTDGNWKVYSASPDRDDFGTNLDSKTTARWHASSQGGNGLEAYAETEDTNKYIFQVQPKMTVTAADKKKTYGVELSDSDLTVTKTVKFKGQDGTDIDVHNYEAAFQEGDVMKHYNTGTISVESAGAVAAATRTGGARAAEDGNNAIYDIVVSGNLTSKDGYGEANYVNGNLEITKKDITLITNDIETTYGNGNKIYDEVNNDLLHLEGLVSWDKESDVFAEITPGVSVDTTNKSQSPYKIVDGKPATDEKGNLYTNDVRDDKGYSITTNYHNVANNYNVTSTEGHVKVTKAKLQVKVGDVSTKYGTAFDTSKYTYSYADGIVNGDTAESLNASLSKVLGLLPNQYVNTAARDGEDGVWTADAGDNYTITLKSKNGKNFFDHYLKNYDTEVSGGEAIVEKADLTVTRKGIETVYGTVKTDDGTMTTYTDLVNGDTDDIAIDNGNYGTAYNDELTKTNNVGKYNYRATLNSDSDVLRNYNVIDEGTNYVNITPYTITKKDIVDGKPAFSTVYGTTTTPVEVAIKGVNGDATVGNTATTSAYEYGTDGTPVKTKDVGDKIYDITSVLTNKNYRFEDGSDTKLFANTASVTPAPLKVDRKGYTTEYGTVLLEDAAHRFTTWGTLANGDVDDIKVDNKDYGGAYLDGNTRTNNASDKPYTFKEALTSASNVLRNYVLDDTQTNSVTITPHTITSDDIVNGNPTFETVYGNTDKKLDVVINGVNGDGNIANTSTTTAYIYDKEGNPIKTANVGNDYSITSVLNNKNYRFDNGSATKTFEKSAKVTEAELKIKTENVETKYGTVKTTTSTVDGLVNGDLPTGFIYDYGDYGGAYLDDKTKTNDVNTYHFGTEIKTMGKDGLPQQLHDHGW